LLREGVIWVRARPPLVDAVDIAMDDVDAKAKALAQLGGQMIGNGDGAVSASRAA
jgi:hypothetical protein